MEKNVLLLVPLLSLRARAGPLLFLPPSFAQLIRKKSKALTAVFHSLAPLSLRVDLAQSNVATLVFLSPHGARAPDGSLI